MPGGDSGGGGDACVCVVLPRLFPLLTCAQAELQEARGACGALLTELKAARAQLSSAGGAPGGAGGDARRPRGGGGAGAGSGGDEATSAAVGHGGRRRQGRLGAAGGRRVAWQEDDEEEGEERGSCDSPGGGAWRARRVAGRGPYSCSPSPRRHAPPRGREEAGQARPAWVGSAPRGAGVAAARSPSRRSYPPPSSPTRASPPRWLSPRARMASPSPGGCGPPHLPATRALHQLVMGGVPADEDGPGPAAAAASHEHARPGQREVPSAEPAASPLRPRSPAACSSRQHSPGQGLHAHVAASAAEVAAAAQHLAAWRGLSLHGSLAAAANDKAGQERRGAATATGRRDASAPPRVAGAGEAQQGRQAARQGARGGAGGALEGLVQLAEAAAQAAQGRRSPSFAIRAEVERLLGDWDAAAVVAAGRQAGRRERPARRGGLAAGGGEEEGSGGAHARRSGTEERPVDRLGRAAREEQVEEEVVEENDVGSISLAPAARAASSGSTPGVAPRGTAPRLAAPGDRAQAAAARAGSPSASDVSRMRRAVLGAGGGVQQARGSGVTAQATRARSPPSVGRPSQEDSREGATAAAEAAVPGEPQPSPLPPQLQQGAPAAVPRATLPSLAHSAPASGTPAPPPPPSSGGRAHLQAGGEGPGAEQQRPCCQRCGQALGATHPSLQAPQGPCRFHPAQLPDPNPLRYTPPQCTART